MCVEKCSALGERFKDLFMCIMLIFIRLIFRSWSALQMWRIRIRGQLNGWRGCSVIWRGKSLY
jgi:hypothetical protein